jgi:capsule polysaccharide export protein KpsE/RkpR
LTIVDLVNEFQQVFVSYREVREANPGWTERMVQDYMSLKQDVVLTASGSSDVQDQIDAINAEILLINAQIDLILSLLGEENQYIVQLEADIRKLRAISSKQAKTISNVNQSLADLQ